MSTLRRLAPLGLLLLLLPAAARADEFAEEVDADEAVYAVQRRPIMRGHEFNASLGVLPLDALTVGITLGAGYTYHFNSVIGWQIAHFRYAFNVDTQAYGQLESRFGVVPSRIPPVNWLLDSNVVFKILGGKAVWGTRHMLGGEIDVILGPAVGILTTQQLSVGVNAGLGLRVFLNRYFSARLELRQYELFLFNPFKVNHVFDVSIGASLNLR